MHFVGLKESDVRFSVIDPIVKGICRCTHSYYETEDPVTSESTNLGPIPEYQEKSSVKSIQDYTIYKVFLNVHCRVLLIEAKTQASFNKNAVAQTIGYYIATTESTAREDGSILSPMAVLMSDNQYRVIFFPFKQDTQPCVDAVVSPPYKLFEDTELSMPFFYYL